MENNISEPQETKQQSPETKSDFMIEKIKGRPISKRKLFKRTVTTIVMALLFGMVACVTFLVLMPYLQTLIHEEKEPDPIVVTFPEDPEEMEPEQMLAENIQTLEDKSEDEPEGAVLEEEQIQEILSEVVFDMNHYAQMYQALSEFTTTLEKSMVSVTCVDSSVDWLNTVQEEEKKTSGVIIANNNKELLILTYYDVVKNAESIFVKFNSGIQEQVQIKGYNEDTGLVVLAAPISGLGTEYWNENITIAKLGSTNVRNLKTSPIIAVGMPMGTEGSVGYGMITSTTGQINYVDANYKILQTDIAGNMISNGVLFNLSGEVVGVISNHKPQGTEQVITAYGISDLKKLLTKLSNSDPMAYIGLRGTLVTLEANTQIGIPYGAYIQDVELNSPAMKAGLLPGDVITQVNDHQVLAFSDYSSVLYGVKPGEKVKINIYRFVQDEYKMMNMELEADEVH